MMGGIEGYVVKGCSGGFRSAARLRIIALLALTAAFSSSFSGPSYAGEISVDIQVESHDVYMGESFIIQIVVNGSDKVEPPELSSIEGFTVEYLGGSNNSSQSITIINGRIEKSVRRSYIFSYRFTPKRVGRLRIPSLAVEVEGRTFRTEPVVINVRKPEESEDFKLRISLSKDECYVGEPVLLTVTWYIGRDVRDFQFTMPLLDMDAFLFEDPQANIDKRKSYYRVPIGKGEVIAEKGRALLDGRSYATLSFSKAIIPREAGTFVLPEVVVACEAVTRVRSRRDFFDDFFSDDFFGGFRGKLRKYVVPSNRLTLTVKPLPLEGRPPGFAGHVGKYRVTATAEPTEVNVGDPITLNIVVEGPDYLGNVDFPPLSTQEALARDFKIPSERAEGRIEGRKKVFTQTIRAKDDRVKEIPAIKLPYFNTEKGRYEVASTEPIPITVHPTKVVTAMDAEGSTVSGYTNPVEKWKEGIAYNYEGPELLRTDYYGFSSIILRPVWLLVVLSPPILFLIVLLCVAVVRKRKEDVDVRRARGALKRLLKGVDGLLRSGAAGRELGERMLEQVRTYLGDKLNRQGATLTSADVRGELEERGVNPETVGELLEIMDELEAITYAQGVSTAEDEKGLAERLKSVVKKVDREIK